MLLLILISQSVCAHKANFLAKHGDYYAVSNCKYKLDVYRVHKPSVIYLSLGKFNFNLNFFLSREILPSPPLPPLLLSDFTRHKKNDEDDEQNITFFLPILREMLLLREKCKFRTGKRPVTRIYIACFSMTKCFPGSNFKRLHGLLYSSARTWHICKRVGSLSSGSC